VSDHAAILIGIAGLFITVGSAALALSVRLGKLETKIDTMWNWWLTRADVRVGGRRRTDVAADSSE
jgi:hypothetical protein